MPIALSISLLACMLSAVLAGGILARGPTEKVHRRAALLMACASAWCAFDVFSLAQSDPRVATALIRASASGWVWIVPLLLDIALRLHVDRLPRLRAMLRPIYAVHTALLVPAAFTPLLIASVEKSAFGWAVTPGPLYAAASLYGSAGFVAALAIGWGEYRRSCPAEQGQVRFAARVLTAPLIAITVFDGMFALFGVTSLRLSGVSCALWGGVLFLSFGPYGTAFVSPGSFAGVILETLRDGVAMLRPDGRIRSANPSLARLLGCDPVVLPGLALTERLSDLPEPDADGETERRCELRALDGTTKPVAISTAPVLDEQGAAMGYVLVARDLAEVELLRNRLALSGRLAAVGELAAGIAHEINNPLTFVRANLSLLRQHWDELASEVAKTGGADAYGDALAEGEELIDESLEGVDRAVSIVRDVRGLAHGGTGQREVADLNALLDGVVRMTRPQLRDHAAIEKQYGPNSHLACAPQELQQVFLNLVLNAGQAIEGSGTITIRTESRDDCVVVSVIDDGCGIPPDLIERIFDPFFTTKAVGEGTGLGLGIAYGIVRKHGGEINVESAVGRGSVFRVRLPIERIH